jgi:hypothetical protein
MDPKIINLAATWRFVQDVYAIFYIKKRKKAGR